MSETLLKPIVELSYLTAQNVGRYRLVMRYFYEQHQRMRNWLRPEEVYEGVKAYRLLPDYTLEQCQQDLDKLVEWKDLIPRHDGGRATSVEEYLRKKFRYQMTPYAIEIERMVAGLENIRGYGGSLEPSLLDSIYAGLQQLAASRSQFSEGTAESLWLSIYEPFTKLCKNAANYLAELNSARAEELMLTEAFLAYKDSLTIYLRNFVQSLQRSALRIQGLLSQLPEDTVAALVAGVVRDRRRIPQLEEPLPPEEEERQVRQEWENLKRWFAGNPGDSSDVIFLEQATKNAIARVVRCALRIQDRQRSGVSRRRELDYLGRWFLSCADINEAHRLAAYAFGLYRTRHFQGYDDKDTDNADVSMWETTPNFRPLRSRSRRKSREGGPHPIAARRLEAARAREEYLARQQEEEALLRSFLAREKVTLSELEVQPAKVRQTLLHWIGQCLMSPRRQTVTPEGVRITLLLPPAGKRTVLRCSDGDLELPDFTIKFSAVGRKAAAPAGEER